MASKSANFNKVPLISKSLVDYKPVVQSTDKDKIISEIKKSQLSIQILESSADIYYMTEKPKPKERAKSSKSKSSSKSR